MEYRTFEKTGESISLLGFGTMRLPTLPDKNIDEAEAVKMIHHAIDNGVNYMDTAYVYHGGTSESVLGKALKDGYREKVFIADKMPVWSVNCESDLQRLFDEQLARLGVQSIDMYLVHNLNVPLWKQTKKFNILDFLEKKRGEGKIKHIGFSFHDDLSLFKEIIDAYAWDFCQIQLNYMDVKWQAGVEGLKYAGGKGIPVIIMEPLKGGRLTDAFPENVSELWKGVGTERTPADWALRWVADFPEVLTILSGMSSFAQVEENIRILSSVTANSLTEKEHAVIGKVSAAYNELVQYPCTACGYCLPCTQGIDIPLAMNLYNEWFMFAQSEKTQLAFALEFPGSPAPADCTKCKHCEEHCPQHLNVSEMMEKSVGLFSK
ncbi:MAG: aldo/keto reductase [Clostridiales bacterium]|nr:aldo/keto reductase [Clostridiales bacterium]